MSLRNRELLNLVVVGALTALGFASVYIARQSVVSTASLSYAGFFLALYLVAHLVARYAVPYADPYLLPMAALLTAIGLTEIYRIHPDDAFRQGVWIIIAVAAFAAIAAGASALEDCILDGEVVALDHNGAPDFAALQAALSEGRSKDLTYFVFGGRRRR